MAKWLIVHEETSYNTNPNIIGFNFDKANNIEPGDYIIYYFKGGRIKGLYKVANKPWAKESSWTSQIQIELQPVKILDDSINIRPLIAILDLF